MVLSTINSASKHFFFVYGPFQNAMVRQFVEHYALKKWRIINVSGFDISEGGAKAEFADIYSDIVSTLGAMVYIPHINSIYSNMLYSTRSIVLANIPDGLPNILHIRPNLRVLLKQFLKKLYCAIVHRKKFTIFFDNLVGYNFNRYNFAFSPYPDLIWDKNCPVVPIPLPWQTRFDETKTPRTSKIATIIGQPLENVVSKREKEKLIGRLCSYALNLEGVEKVYYILHPRETLESVRLPERVKAKRLSSPVESVLARKYVDYCLGVFSFSLVNIKFLSKATVVCYHLSDHFTYSSQLREIFDRIGMREI